MGENVYDTWYALQKSEICKKKKNEKDILYYFWLVFTLCAQKKK